MTADRVTPSTDFLAAEWTAEGLVSLRLAIVAARPNLPFMPLAPRVILHSPISDDALLESFVEQCLTDGVSLLAIVGPGSGELEDRIDWIIVGDGSKPARFLCTTSHPAAPFDDVMNMMRAWVVAEGDAVQVVRL